METTINQRIFWQIIIWACIVMGLPFLFSGGQMGKMILFRSLGVFLGVLVFIPLNLNVYFPRFYANGKLSKFLGISIVTIFSIAVVIVWLRSFFDVPHPEIPLDIGQQNTRFKFVFYTFGNFFPLIVVFLSSTLYEISIVANQSARETAQLNAEKLEAELKFLKSQINPHFLFNSLNNIYTLTVLNPKAAGDSLLKLSEMLRYLLYECDAEKVLLGRELVYLKNYISLFELKDDDVLNIRFDASDVHTSVMIAPLLFVPFIENAFKHSQIENLQKGWINIILFGDEKQVYFEVKNSLPEVAFSKDLVGGIGLQNVQRQLELLYPGKHQLNILKTAEAFSVELTINL